MNYDDYIRVIGVWAAMSVLGGILMMAAGSWLGLVMVLVGGYAVYRAWRIKKQVEAFTSESETEPYGDFPNVPGRNTHTPE